WDWGLPTALSLLEVKKAVKVPVVASGGLRNGLEAAKCLALGASMCGMAHPFLVRAAESWESLLDFAELTLAELRAAMFLVGAASISELAHSRYILTGALAQEISGRS
ncbi:MAG TPA: alpha-hydroxy-acid oxidizing protein, partial [Nitrososphaera sp.]|nr:alpha-hydroxy-acid oxidizing protein [Nitrososphaera sp.]